MEEQVIGMIWRYGVDDYSIMMADITGDDQAELMRIYDKYSDDSTNERGNGNMTLNAAGSHYWEERLAAKAREARRRELARELYQLGMVDTNALYDYQADEQLTEDALYDALFNPKDTVYTLETFLQFCDGSQTEEDSKKFFKAAMDIVHYMEGEN